MAHRGAGRADLKSTRLIRKLIDVQPLQAPETSKKPTELVAAGATVEEMRFVHEDCKHPGEQMIHNCAIRLARIPDHHRVEGFGRGDEHKRLPALVTMIAGLPTAGEPKPVQRHFESYSQVVDESACRGDQQHPYAGTALGRSVSGSCNQRRNDGFGLARCGRRGHEDVAAGVNRGDRTALYVPKCCELPEESATHRAEVLDDISIGRCFPHANPACVFPSLRHETISSRSRVPRTNARGMGSRLCWCSSAKASMRCWSS